MPMADADESPGAVLPGALPARLRPHVVHLVAGLERARILGQLQPREFAAGEDVHVGRDGVGIVERAGANEQSLAAGRDRVAAPDVGAALVAEERLVVLAGATFERDRSRSRTAGLDKFLLDPDVDHKRAAGDSLAVATMARMHDQRTIGQLVTYRSAGASTFEVHSTLLEKIWDCPDR